MSLSMLTPADSFALSFGPVDRDLWSACRPDAEVQIAIGDSPLISGYVDTRRRVRSRGQNGLQIEGRCKIGRLVDESSPLQTFRQEAVLDAISELANPWFSVVELSNARNRSLILRRRAVTVRSGFERDADGVRQFGTDRATKIVTKRRGPKKVEPGETRWEVLSQFLEFDHLLAWSSGDGKELIIARPNYNQESQFRFLIAAPGSSRARLANVVECEYAESVADRYTDITVMGAGRGDTANYGKRILRNTWTVAEAGGEAGFGESFLRPKSLIVTDDKAKNPTEARRLAEREALVRNSSGVELRLVVRGHTQALTPRAAPALYAPDTMCDFEDEELGIRGRYLIAEATYRRARGSESTELTLIPEGTELTE